MFFNFKVCLTTCFCTLKEIKVRSHEFSRNQKIVTDSFSWSLGTELKNSYPWDWFEILGLASSWISQREIAKMLLMAFNICILCIPFVEKTECMNTWHYWCHNSNILLSQNWLFFHYENSCVVIAQTASVDISTDSKLQKLFARI